jgi:hypothetical protein
MSANDSDYYYGSTFSIGNAIYLGGVVALIGYLVVLMVFIMVSSLLLLRSKSALDEKVFSISMLSVLPFIFQRSAVWESALLILIFSPFVVSFLGRSPNYQAPDSVIK